MFDSEKTKELERRVRILENDLSRCSTRLYELTDIVMMHVVVTKGLPSIVVNHRPKD